MVSNVFKLNRPDLNYLSPEWMALETWAKEQLEETYKRLSGWNLDDKELRQLQGRASILQQMLGFRTQTADFSPRN